MVGPCNLIVADFESYQIVMVGLRLVALLLLLLCIVLLLLLLLL